MSLVSVIMPSFNSEKFISDAIDSVISQTLSDWELLICDDGSTDRTFAIGSSYAALDNRIQIVTNRKNKGAPGARNTCLELATGEYISFLDSDDLWLPEKLELQVEFMQKRGLAFSFSYHDVITESNEHIFSFKAPSRVNASKMKLSNFIPCLTVVYNANMLGKVVQPDIKKRNDYALWLKILNSGQAEWAYCLPIVTAKYRSNSYGLSSNKMSTIYYYRKCLTEFGGVSFIGSHIFSLLYIVLGVVKAKFGKVYNWLVVIV